MVIDKNYFLTRLANGEDINDIGNDIADMMNAAIAEHTAAQEAAREAEAKRAAEVELLAHKRALAEEMTDLVLEYGELVEPGSTVDMELSEEDLDLMVKTLDEMFQLMSAVKTLKVAIDNLPDEALKPATNIVKNKKVKTDDEALADFLATIFQ